MSNYNLAIIHTRGWSDAAGSRPMKLDYRASAAELRAYEEGYILGQADRRRASDYSAAKFGVKFGEIKLQQPVSKTTQEKG